MESKKDFIRITICAIQSKLLLSNLSLYVTSCIEKLHLERLLCDLTEKPFCVHSHHAVTFEERDICALQHRQYKKMNATLILCLFLFQYCIKHELVKTNDTLRGHTFGSNS